jgi:glycogen operon protein
VSSHPGVSAPLGASVRPGGVNFSIYSKHATGVELLLFDDVDAERPARRIRLEPRRHRSFPYWHVFVPDAEAGQLYAWCAEGPWAPGRGLRFDPEKLLLDPYARLVEVPSRYDRAAAARPGSNAGQALLGVVIDARAYDWEGDRSPRCAASRSVVYEAHLAGFTRHPSSGIEESRRGTYAGLVEKIDYLRDLGVTAVELMPVFQFDEQDAPPGLTNYWGYAPVSFFAPHRAYSSQRGRLGPLDDFRDMVKALHRAGIEVILDVVYNHTAEADAAGPTLSLRGLDNPTYYLLEAGRYLNYSGTGNTLNAGHPVVRRLIQDSLRHWVQVMHVDGFRFDLASILARDQQGRPAESPHTIGSIETDPVLVDTKLIAEPWDAGGLYQVGSFAGDRFLEWNGRFRDDVRSFVRGDSDSVRPLADRLLGSPDLYARDEREPERSVNFVTAHDGFTLNDLVSYDRKHNLANGEGDRDGHGDNRSWNCGVEGASDDLEIEALRARQVRNLLLLTMIATGIPMLLMGDEVRRTQRGNNNAYCQDSELSWFDWRLLERHADLHRFLKLLIRWRLGAAGERGPERVPAPLLRGACVEWHGVRLYQPDWSRDSHSLALSIRSAEGAEIYAAFDAWREPLRFELPPRTPPWRRLVDTSLPSPDDIAEPGADQPAVEGDYLVQARSAVVLTRQPH